MNENLDLTKILYRCPEGTKFYSTIFGEITFVGIRFSSNYPIMVKVYDKYNDITINESFTKDGKYARFYDAECTLFPSKDQRYWSKFERFWDKPKVEKFDPKTFQPFDKVLARNSEIDNWTIEYYSYGKKVSFRNEDEYIQGLVYGWKYVIPYNKDTKHLIGTDKDCPEYYKWWEK